MNYSSMNSLWPKKFPNMHICGAPVSNKKNIAG